MKYNDKRVTIFSIIIIIILTIWIAFTSFKYKENHNRNVEAHYKLVEICKNSGDKLSKEECDEIIKRGIPVMKDSFTVFFQLLINTNLSKIQIIAPIIIIILASYSFYREYTTGFYKYALLRMNYKNYIKTSILKTYKCLWILPAFIIILFAFSCIISGHFNIDLTLSYWQEYYIPVSITYIRNFIPFIFIFVLNIILNSVFYANLSLIVIQKSKNYIVNILASYILFIFCDIFLEIFIGVIFCEKILKISSASSLFNLFNCWVYDGISSIPLYTLYCLLLAIISLIILICVYRDKEKVIIESEE